MKNSKAVKYNKNLDTLYRLYKRADGSLSQRLDKMGQHICAILEDSPVEVKDGDNYYCSSAYMASGLLWLFLADMKNFTTHVFVEGDDLVDFLFDTAVRDIGGMVKFVSDNGSARAVITRQESDGRHTYDVYDPRISLSRGKIDFDEMRKILDEENLAPHGYDVDIEKFLGVCVHLPGLESDSDCSFYFALSPDGNLRVVCSCDDGIGAICLDDDFDFDSHRYVKLVFNIIAYMNAFPECVKTGLPKGFVFDNPTGSRKVRLGGNDFVRKHAADKAAGITKSPHFRAGHFRYLGSDFFKNKQGQFTYVKPTVVNGRNAKTLVEDVAV